MSVLEQRLAVAVAAGRVGTGDQLAETTAAIALDELEPGDLAAICAAAAEIREQHPLEWVGGMPAKQAEAWLGRLHELEAAALARLGFVADEFRNQWVDVLAPDGRWHGKWSSSRAEAALSCAYWWSLDGLERAGVAIAPPREERDAAVRAEQAETRRAEAEAAAMSEGLLALLDW